MQFVIQKSDLVGELQTVTGVVEKRATLPILSNLLLEAGSGGLHVRASDLEVSVRGMAPAEVIKKGAVTLPAAKLLEIARSLPDAEVQFKLMDGNHVSLSCERTRYRLAGQPVDEFPSFPVLESEPIEVPASSLREMIERVSFAITTEDPRYTLNGALLVLQKDGLRLVATDGHRLAYVHKDVDLAIPGDEISAIVPKKALGEVFKLTAEAGEDDTISFGKEGNHIFFMFRDHQLVSTVPDGPFPNYENVMPESCGTSVCISTTELMQAARRVSLLASDRYGKAVRFSLSSGRLELSYEADMGKAEETLSIDYDGDQIDIGFNARYVLDFLSVVGSDQVLLELDPRRAGDQPTDEKGDRPGDKPGQLRPEPAGKMDYRYIIMPMNLL